MKMAILSKVYYGLQEAPVKTPVPFYTELAKVSQEFMWNHIAKVVLGRKNTPGGIMTLHLKLYNMAVMRKIAGSGHKNSKNRQLDQWNGRKDSEISQQSYNHLNFDKGTRNT